MDFLHIEYHDQIPWTADTSNIEFVSVANLSNYGFFFINVECCNSSEKNVVCFVKIWYNNQVACVAHGCKIALGFVPNLNNYGNFVCLL